MANDPVEVRVPLINPNEPESLLAELLVEDGELVKPGQLLASFETTKSTFELNAETGGYVRGLRFKAGESARAGELLCFLTTSADQPLPVVEAAQEPAKKQSAPAGLRITQPAMALAKELHIDFDTLPKGSLITESVVRELGASIPAEEDPTALLIYGGGGHAKSLIDLIRRMGSFAIAGILDDSIAAGTLILDVPVLGGGELLPALRRKGIFQAVNAVGGIGSIAPRRGGLWAAGGRWLPLHHRGPSTRVYRTNRECRGRLPGIFQRLYRQRCESGVWHDHQHRRNPLA